MGTNWLVQAHAAAKTAGVPRRMFHPQIGVVFDEENHTLRFGWTEQPHFTAAELTVSNPWTANLFLRRDLLSELTRQGKYDPSVFGNPATQLICEQLAEGGGVHPVHETCVFLRRQSYLPQTSVARPLLPPTQLLSPAKVANRQREKSTACHLTVAESHRPVPLGPPVTKPSRYVRAVEKLRCKWRKWRDKIRREWNRFRTKHLGYRPPLRKEAPAVAPPEVPTWLWKDCLAAHQVEPKIFPAAYYLSDCRWPKSFAAAAEIYQAICRDCRGPISHVILLPWLKTGGVDLEALNYVRAIVEASPENRVAVVTTENCESTWSHRLPAGVVFVPFGQLAASLPPAEQTHLLATWLVQLQPAVVHNMNSHLAYVVIREHGKELKQICRLYTSVFCEDFTAEGKTVGWAFDRLPECCEHLDGVFADNQRILRVLRDTFGLAEDRLHIHYQPIELAAGRRSVSDAGHGDAKLQVLWAGRLDRQKRLDLLARIAEQLVDAPIHFTVYGSTVLTYDRLDLNWQKYSNVTYRGPFDGFSTLPLAQFDLLLHTAQWEGLPNVLLEALAYDLPVMASAVGGVPELIEDQQTGICVMPFDDVDRYCRELRALAADRGRLARLSFRGRERIATRHSWQSFQRTLEKLPEYLTPRQDSARFQQPSKAA